MNKKERETRRFEALVEAIRAAERLPLRWRDHNLGQRRDLHRRRTRAHPHRARDRRRVQRAHRRAVGQRLTRCVAAPEHRVDFAASASPAPTHAMTARRVRRARVSPVNFSRIEGWEIIEKIQQQPGWRARLNTRLRQVHDPRVCDIERLPGFHAEASRWARHWPILRCHCHDRGMGGCWRTSRCVRMGPFSPWEPPQLPPGDRHGAYLFTEAMDVARDQPPLTSLRDGDLSPRWRSLRTRRLTYLKPSEGVDLVTNPLYHPEWIEVVDAFIAMWSAGVETLDALDLALKTGPGWRTVDLRGVKNKKRLQKSPSRRGARV